MTRTLLFVYGSLLSGYPGRWSRELHRSCSICGRARIAGYLIDLGEYPALIYDPSAQERVEGELLHLPEDPAWLGRLDEYEGFDPGRPAAENLYLRQWLFVQVQDGEPVPAWVYSYRGDASAWPRIHRSDYLAYFWENETHQDFAIRSAYP